MSTVDDYGVLFPASVVGSMPRSDFVRAAAMSDLPLPPGRRDRILEMAISHVVALQEAAGLDVITDGEWRRPSYMAVIAELAHGFEVGHNPTDGRPWTVVVEELSSKNPGFVVREAKYLKRVSRAKIKVTLPAPALLGERMWDPDRSAKAYPTRRDFVLACVPFLRREVELLRDEGVDIVQIDDPHLCLLVDHQVRARYEDADKEADFSAATVNEVVSGISGVKVAVHLCRRAGARVRGEACHRGDYTPILPFVNRLAVNHLTLEFSCPEMGDPRIFKSLREDFEIGLGCVGVHPGQVDTPETIVTRVEQVLKFLSPERIVLNPDCGFAPGSAARIDIDEVYTKLKNEVEAARRLRDQFA